MRTFHRSLSFDFGAWSLIRRLDQQFGRYCSLSWPLRSSNLQGAVKRTAVVDAPNMSEPESITANIKQEKPDIDANLQKEQCNAAEPKSPAENEERAKKAEIPQNYRETEKVELKKLLEVEMAARNQYAIVIEQIKVALTEPIAKCEARQALAVVGTKTADQKKEAVKIALDLVNDENNRKVARTALEPQKQKAEQLIDALQAAPTLQATLKNLKELKAPLCLLRAHQTLQELLITGCYQDLLDTEEAKEIVLNGDAAKEVTQEVHSLNEATKDALDGEKQEETTLSPIEGLMKLIEKRLDREEKSNTSKQLEDYIATWTQSQKLYNLITQQEIDNEVIKMRNDWRNNKHSHIANLGFGIEFFMGALSRNQLLQSMDEPQKDLKMKKHVETILDYLYDIIDEPATRVYINKEGLDSSLIDIRTEIEHRAQEFIKSNENAWKYRVNAKLIEQDVKRRETLTNALLLGEAEVEQEHIKQIEELINTATQPVPEEEKQLILPQLVEARVPRNDPNVRLEIVFDPSLTHEQKKNAFEDLKNILPGPSEMCDRPIIKSPQAIVHKNFCANKDKLARLGVRAVLMGEYGLDKIKVRNRPEINRIYSQSGLETAEGFISTGYFESKRGQETYYAPIGWRRVAIDIGLSTTDFWNLYGVLLTSFTWCIRKVMTNETGFAKNASHLNSNFLINIFQVLKRFF